MSPAQSPARRRTARAVRWLAAALGALALTATAAAQAQAATVAIRGRAAAVAATTPAPITLNTANWSGSAGFGSRAPA